MDGFKIVTDDGTEYHFTDAETSMQRNLVGINCKTFINEYFDEVKTSWYLSKIVLPTKQREINFSYLTGVIRFRNGLNESLSLNIAAENHSAPGVGCPTGPACDIWESRFSTCSREQAVQSKFISKIETNDGDKIEFIYDEVSRADLMGGLRLATIKLLNFKGRTLKNVHFNSIYKTAINALNDFESKRLFLNSIEMRDGLNTLNDQQVYSFVYKNFEDLPKRLSYAQDIYGFYNGKLLNSCLIPKLEPGDINYSRFNNGTGYGLVAFGDRSVDINYAEYGLLNRLSYPTGGYDSIVYTSNYILSDNLVEKPAGGVSVKKYLSYSYFNHIPALEKEYIYRNYSDNKLSAFLITASPLFSEVRTVKSDGYTCGAGMGGIDNVIICVGPACTKATSYSNSIYNTTASGTQHIYHRSVQEYNKAGIVDNGFIEHKYKYYMDGGLVPVSIMGELILGSAYNLVPDILIGEEQTDYYKKKPVPGYQLVKSINRVYENTNESIFKNYFVRKNYQSICSNRPNQPHYTEIEAFDITEGRVYFNSPVVKTTIEKDYANNGVELITVTNMEYNTTLYTYPKRIKTKDSKQVETIIERKYPPDYTDKMFMNARNIISPVLNEKIYRNTVLQMEKNTNYLAWNGNSNLVVPSFIELKNGTGVSINKFLFKDYDIYGNVLQLSKENDIDEFYIYGYKNNYVVGQISGVSSSDIQSLGLNSAIINNPVSDGALRSELNKIHTNLPSGAKSITYTFEPQIGVTSQTSKNILTTFYEYDPFNRLMHLKDHQGNIVKKYCYNYAGLPINCYDVTFTNNQAYSGQFQKTICAQGYTGSTVTYTVPVGSVTSFSSIADANTLAQAKVNQDGPGYANANGTCTANPTTIYARLEIENWWSDGFSDYGDMVVRFYQDASCTIAASVTGLNVNYSMLSSGESYCEEGYSTSAYISGVSSYTLLYNAPMYQFLDWYTSCGYSYLLNNGTGYQIVNY